MSIAFKFNHNHKMKGDDIKSEENIGKFSIPIKTIDVEFVLLKYEKIGKPYLITTETMVS